MWMRALVVATLCASCAGEFELEPARVSTPLPIAFGQIHPTPDPFEGPAYEIALGLGSSQCGAPTPDEDTQVRVFLYEVSRTVRGGGRFPIRQLSFSDQRNSTAAAASFDGQLGWVTIHSWKGTEADVSVDLVLPESKANFPHGRVWEGVLTDCNAAEAGSTLDRSWRGRPIRNDGPGIGR
jgi:hypothetical protein